MENGIGELGTLLFWVGLMAVLSLMDALARRKRERQGPDPSETVDPSAPDPGGRDRSPSLEDRSDWAYLGGGAGGSRPDVPPEMERPVPGRGWDVPEPPTPARGVEAAEPASAGEAPPALTAAAEEIRERGRRELLAVSSESDPQPVPMAAGSGLDRERRATSGAGHEEPADRLRALFRGDPAALRSAVIYREVLGVPLGSRRGPGGWEERG